MFYLGIRALHPNAAPPAPVVPDEIRNKLKAEGLADLLKDARDYAPLTSEQWETLTNNWHQTFVGLSGENDACRASMLDNCATVESRNHAACSPKNGLKCAAMLQGQPVSNRDELPATQQPQNAQQNIPNNIPSGLIEAVNDLLNNDGSRGRYSAIGCGNAREKIELWLSQRQKWESQRDKNISAGNSPVIGVDLASGPDRTVEVRYFAPPGYVMVPKRLTAENGAKCLLVGEFSEKKFINCTECFGDDECETCDGSGRIEISVPVSWTNIKAIWAKGVEHFAAAPKQETL